MQYKTILKPYDLAMLVGKAVGDTKAAQEPFETADWNSALNKYAIDGWIVKNSGVIQSGSNIVFWALLEKEEQEQALNTGF